jgi:hypothetical protein
MLQRLLARNQIRERLKFSWNAERPALRLSMALLNALGSLKLFKCLFLCANGGLNRSPNDAFDKYDRIFIYKR